jgi:hypothetical protein
MSLITDREPTLLAHPTDRKLIFQWTVRRVEDDSQPATLVVNLTVRHNAPGKEYTARLRNATNTDSGVSIERFGWNDPVWSRAQPVARYSRQGLLTFAEAALAALRQDDAAGEPLLVDLTETPPAAAGSDPPPTTG